MPRPAASSACRALVPVSGRTAPEDTGRRDAALAAIAADLGFETLQLRNRDALDFRDVGVGALRRALEAAYAAGRATAGRG